VKELPGGARVAILHDPSTTHWHEYFRSDANGSQLGLESMIGGRLRGVRCVQVLKSERPDVLSLGRRLPSTSADYCRAGEAASVSHRDGLNEFADEASDVVFYSLIEHTARRYFIDRS